MARLMHPQKTAVNSARARSFLSKTQSPRGVANGKKTPDAAHLFFLSILALRPGTFDVFGRQ